jgi:hypothetical protein
MQRTCRRDGCLEAVRTGDVCDGCRKRGKRGGYRQRHVSPLDRLREAALAYADASDLDEQEFQRAESNLAKSAVHYVETLPRWQQPPPPVRSDDERHD